MDLSLLEFDEYDKAARYRDDLYTVFYNDKAIKAFRVEPVDIKMISQKINQPYRIQVRVEKNDHRYLPTKDWWQPAESILPNIL